MHLRWLAPVRVCLFGLWACSSNTADPTTTGNPGTRDATSSASGGAAGSPQTSGGASVGGAGPTGASGVGGAQAGASITAGGGGAPVEDAGAAGSSGGIGGASGEGGNAGTGGAGEAGSAGKPDGGDPASAGDTVPWRPLKITVAPGQHVHPINGDMAGIDNRAAKMAGKLIVDITVNQGAYDAYLAKRGFHVFGIHFYMCPGIDDWSLGTAHNGDCRANTFDGLKHGVDAHETPATSIAGKLKAGLVSLQQQFPEEDWGYFLNQDGSIRWSDVGFTGHSHAAQTTARIGHMVRLYRAVSQSGPRDDTCGNGAATADYDPQAPPYDATCTHCTTIPCAGAKHYADWLDEPVVTPIDRFYSFAGKQDVQFGDFFFHTEHVHYVGQPVNISTAKAPYDGSRRFYADVGHVGFPNGFPIDAMNIAFGVLPENLNPTF